ncbi:hypothetical protein PSAB6_60219 [Paraburkholderia sabiae]|nr:hypothetical protein PSAB6_60219 [Paraburkholderia sabiae]
MSDWIEAGVYFGSMFARTQAARRHGRRDRRSALPCFIYREAAEKLQRVQILAWPFLL